MSESQAKKIVPYFSLPAAEVLDQLETSLDGIDEVAVSERRGRYGSNEIARTNRVSRFSIFVDQFANPIIAILIAAGLITFFVNDVESTLFIFLAVLVNVLLGFYQEDKAETAITGLQKFLKEEARVVRAGVEGEIDARELVPGDIIRLLPGSRVPADCRIIYTNELLVDESILTGESMPVSHKSEKPVAFDAGVGDRLSMLFAGTFVANGIAVGVVTATGLNTELGLIAKSVSSAKRDFTPLQSALNRFALKASIVLGALTIILFAIGVGAGHGAVEMFLVAVAVAVSAVPEGLPVALTVILAVGVERLAKRKGVVRKLLAAETLGSTTLIMTDKTGTLTQARMELAGIFSELPKEEVLEMALLNTDIIIENPLDEPASWRMVGRPLEAALVRAAALHAVLLPEVKTRIKVLETKPFNSTQKYSAVKFEQDGHTHWNYVGAPEVLSTMTDFSPAHRQKLIKQVDELAYAGQRVLAVARNKSLIGLIAFRDPPRPGVGEALHKAALAGVRTVIVTGDHRGTAEALAKEIGMTVHAHEVMLGASVRGMSDSELRKALPHISIFARMTPEDKYRVAEQYRALGHVVAMTGDGVNDAPALKNADIGIALGSGTEIAKGAADLVLLDDNFETIVAAIEEGRRILNNIKKVIIYLLSNSFTGLLLIGGSVLAGLGIPLNALQILWVNFFTDSFPAVSFAFEDGEDYLKQPPPKIRERLFDGQLRFLVLTMSLLTSSLIFGVYFMLMKLGFDAEIVKTFIFAVFSVYTLFLSFAIRHLHTPIYKYNILDNPYLLYSNLFGIGLTLVAVYVPFFNQIMGTVPLPLPWALGVIGFVLIILTLFETIKRLRR